MSTTVSAVEIDAAGVYYADLNRQIRAAVEDGARKVVLKNVAGQRYIGTNLHGAASPEELGKLRIDIDGTPGNDLGAFLDGPTITVHGNAQDGSGNTMNRGRVVVHGRAGDITGFSARGGEMFIRDGAGYRVAIHMKEYGEMRPVLVIGGTTQDFLGEYMAGGVLIILGLDGGSDAAHTCSHVGTGMHGGVMLIRGQVSEHQLAREVGVVDIAEADEALLTRYVADYGELFGVDVSAVSPDQFTKLQPLSTRPFKKLYAY